MKYLSTLIFTLIIIFFFVSCDKEATPVLNDDYKLKLSLTTDLNLELQWDALKLETEIKNYELYKSISETENYSKIATISYDKQKKVYSYKDSFKLDGSKTYYYKVRANTLISQEKYSAIVQYKATTDIDGDGFIENDCEANNPSINPLAQEVCDNIDNNCNENIDENIDDVITGSDLGECQKGILRCMDGSMSVIQEEITAKPELCDGKDNNCNGDIDENIADLITGSNIGECQQGVKTCSNGIYVTITEEIQPQDEICDNKDNNCNGNIDENIAQVRTGSSVGECQEGILECINGQLVNTQEEIQAQNEICDNKDNDCDGHIDNDLYKNCQNICGEGETICIEGHWLGCDAEIPNAGVWQNASPVKRTQFSKVNVQETIYVFGGLLVNNEVSNTFWRYQNSAHSWTQIHTQGSKPAARTHASMAYSSESNAIYLFGGIDSSGTLLNDFWSFNLATQEWTPLFTQGNQPEASYGMTLFSDKYNHIILFGGKTENAINGKTYKYSISDNEWSIIPTPTQPTARYLQSALSNQDNYLYLLGGILEGNSFSGELWKFNLTTFAWTLESTLPDNTLLSESTSYYKNNKLYFFGGHSQAPNSSLSLYIYNLLEQTWETIASTQDNLKSSSILKLSNTKIEFWGGSNNDGSILEDTLHFSLTSKDYEIKTHIGNTYQASIANNSNNQLVYLFGGLNQSGYSNDLWYYSPIDNQWSEVLTDLKPEPRKEASLTYHQSENALYLYGGHNESQEFTDLWVFKLNEGVWEKITTNNSPDVHSSAYLFYREDTLYLFGGRDIEYELHLYEFNTTTSTWLKIETPLLMPETRKEYASIYSPHHDYLFLFGGEKANGSKLNDLWVLDIASNTWVNYHIGITKPSERHSASFIYDSLNHSLYLFGGQNSSQNFNDLWSLEIGTSNWSLIKPSTTDPNFVNREGSQAFWSKNLNENFIYIIGGKNDSYFFDPSRLNMSCDEN